MSTGWIGNWSPGIGDPTAGGWLTVAVYAWAAWVAIGVLQGEKSRKIVLSNNEKIVWRILVAELIALGINKQLDLQTAFTEIGRLLAQDQGWYDSRRQVQEAFIAAVIILGLALLAAMAIWVWKAPASTLLACAGASGLMVFIVVRAASFHRVDELLGLRLASLPLNWVLEMGSLLLIGWCARERVRSQR